MRRRAAFLLALLSAVAPHPARASSSANARVIGSIPFRGGTDLDFAGNYAYVGSYDGYGSPYGGETGAGGLYVIDISDPANPITAGRLPCPGYQDDVGVWRSIVVMGVHDSGPESDQCFPARAGGLRIVDVSDPSAPRQVSFQRVGSGGTHTVTIVGDTGYVYANPGGLSVGSGAATTIVDIRKPSQPKIVGTFTPPHSTGCHDISVDASATRAYCAGSNVTQIWNITDPVHPTVISEIFNPAIFFHHGAVPSLDGSILAIADEAFGLHACDGAATGRSPTGALWFYDISNEALPVLKGSINTSPSTRTSLSGWCTAHNFNMIAGHKWLAIAQYRGGTSVVDFTDASLPKLIGWVIPEGADTWSSYYYRGHLYTGDTVRGFDVIDMDGLPAA